MKILSIVTACVGLTFSAGAQAGCLAGAAVGGVAGHVAGHHALLGAAVGCAVGHHRAAEQRRDETHQPGQTEPN
jgi:hypothetical protein